jgi:hypothetical protein
MRVFLLDHLDRDIGIAVHAERLRRGAAERASAPHPPTNQRDTGNHLILMWLFGFHVPTNDSQQSW